MDSKEELINILNKLVDDFANGLSVNLNIERTDNNKCNINYKSYRVDDNVIADEIINRIREYKEQEAPDMVKVYDELMDVWVELGKLFREIK